jgi:hypothetical protein
MNVTILFARIDSVYKTIPGCDVWDAERDAGWRPEISKAEREHTPEALAHWLIKLAAACRRQEK